MRLFQTMLPQSKPLRLVLFGVALIVLLMPVHAFISTWGGTAIGPLLVWKSWKEGVLIGLFLVAFLWLWRHPAERKQLLGERIVQCIGGYALLTLLVAIWRLDEVPAVALQAGLVMNLRFLLIFTLAYGVFRFGGVSYTQWRSWAEVFLIWAGVGLAVLGILQVTILPMDILTHFGYDKSQTIAPYILIDENPEAMRAFATLRGPNDFGAFLIIPLLLVVRRAVRDRRWLLGVATIAAGLFVSGSRSAWLGAAGALAVLAVTQLPISVLRSRRVIAAGIGSVVAITLLGVAAVTVPAVRLAVFHSSPGDSSLTEGSTDQHWQATADGITRVINQPLGCGPGCAGPASYYGSSARISENYYVQLAEEVGVVGILLFIVLIGLVAWRLWQARSDWLASILLAAGAGMSVIGLFLHVWTDDPLSLTYWALAGMVCGIMAQKALAKPAKSA